MEPVTLLENGNKTLLPFSISVLPETIVSALSNLKALLKKIGVIFKPHDFPKSFFPAISFSKFCYSFVLMIIVLMLILLAITLCCICLWSITGVGLGCRIHLPRPANSIRNCGQIDPNSKLIERTFFISLWNSGPLDKDAMENNLLLKSNRVVKHPDLAASLGPGGNTKILIIDTGFIVSYFRVISKPLVTARLIVEELYIDISWIVGALYTDASRIVKGLYTGISWIVGALYTGISRIIKALYTGVTWISKALYAGFIFQKDWLWRVFLWLGIWAIEELLFISRWYVEGLCAAGRWIAETISAKYQNFKAQGIRIAKNVIQHCKMIGRIIAVVYRNGRALFNFGIWAVVQCFQNRVAIVMFLPNCDWAMYRVPFGLGNGIVDTVPNKSNRLVPVTWPIAICGYQEVPTKRLNTIFETAESRE
ncbi:hypothetical protein EAF04_002435 [Stromatinia cepivora]|nr:hypothetical protein EAF04_002435 [Stromatinia cepivora]